MQKAVFIQCVNRDPEGNVTGSDCANGTTEDDGATCIVPIGYLPNIANAIPGDITVTVQPPATITNPAAYVSRSDDIESGTSTVAINLAP